MNAIIKEIERKLHGTLSGLGLRARYIHSEEPASEDDEVVFETSEGRRSIVSLQVISIVEPSLSNATVTMSFYEEHELGGGWIHRAFAGIEDIVTGNDVLEALDNALTNTAGRFESDDEKPGERVMTHPLLLEAWKGLSGIEGADMSFGRVDGVETVTVNTPSGPFKVSIGAGIATLSGPSGEAAVRNGPGMDFSAAIRDAVTLAGGFRKENVETMKASLDAKVADWTGGEGNILWDETCILDGGLFAQRHVLLHDESDDKVLILRAWISHGSDHASLSVDLDMDTEDFCGDPEAASFPHRPYDRNATQDALRKHMAGEHVEILWANEMDDAHASYIARSAKVGRDEHLVGVSVNLAAPEQEAVKVVRSPLSGIKPKAVSAGLR